MHIRQARRMKVFAALLLAFATATVPFARVAHAEVDADERLNSAVKRLADKIAKFIAAQEDASNELFVGPFTGPGSGGARINQELKQQLEKELKLREVNRGVYAVQGHYQVGEERTLPVTRIYAKIFAPSGEEIFGPSEAAFVDVGETVAVSGATVDLSDENDNLMATKEPKKERIQEAIVKPKFWTRKSPTSPPVPHMEAAGNARIIQYSPKAPAGVELLLKKGEGRYEPCPFDPGLLKRGIALAQMDKGEIFALQIHNFAKERIGAAVFVDGINSFAFSEVPQWKKEGKMIMRPEGGFIRGWNHTRSQSWEFLVSNYGDSAAARFNPGAMEDVGTITVVFYGLGPLKGSDPAAVALGRSVRTPYSSTRGSFVDVLGSVSISYSRTTHPDDLPSP